MAAHIDVAVSAGRQPCTTTHTRAYSRALRNFRGFRHRPRRPDLWGISYTTSSVKSIDGPGSSFQQLPSTSSDASQFPSIVDIPTPGCLAPDPEGGSDDGPRHN